MFDLIHTEKIDNTATSSIQMNDIFTDDYINYEIILSNLSAVSGESDISVQVVDSTNTIDTSSNYYYTWNRQRSGAAISIVNSSSATSIPLAQVGARPKVGTVYIAMYGPKSLNGTHLTFHSAMGNATEYRGYRGKGFSKVNQSITGLNFNFSTDLLYATIKVYGMVKG